ncbi:MAG: nucleotidyltransferase family protein [Deltaproteobacteria bacterium]|nr:nucleotidyltransferase family protein [Deltaproteobacteria bacterium]
MLPKRPSEALNAHREEIRRIVAAHRGANLRVFGSTLRGEDKVGSDLDILIDRQKGMTLFDLCALWHEVETLLGVPVDVVSSGSLNPRWGSQVLAEAQPI